jgi:hypothetical protein
VIPKTNLDIIDSIDADIQSVIQENDEVVLTKSLNQEGEKFSSTNNTNLLLLITIQIRKRMQML